ncbi:MAG: hypothetical protein JWN51_3667 [Phycisphaerales bacterium]|jgi:hypothetical protein|nr:hypothetical protein [Phycisphaerales bacterium]
MVMRGLFIALLLLASAIGRAATSPDETFHQLYGERVRQLKAADRGKGEVEFAKKLLGDARDVSDDKPFQILLCNKAYDYASPYPDGFAIAADAMGLLAKISPESRAAALDKALEMHEKRYNSAPISQRKGVGPAYLDGLIDAADAKADSKSFKESTALYTKALKVAESVDHSRVADIRDAMRELGSRQASQKHLDELTAKVKANPDDTAAVNEVIHALLYEQGRPADAIPMAALLNDASARRAISLAAEDPAGLGGEQLMELGAWHEAQATKAPDQIKVAALEQASKCYSQFLKGHTAEDAEKLKAKRALDGVARMLADTKTRLPHRSVDLLKLINPSRDAVTGTWRMSGSVLTGETTAQSPAASIRIRYRPPEEYDIRVEFARIKGNDAIGQIVSHEGHSFLVVEGGWANTICGIETIDGKRADANPSTQKFPQVLKNDSRSVALIEVRNRSVTVHLNGVVVTHLATDYRDLGLFKQFWDIGDSELGLGATDGAAAFYSVRLTEAGSATKPSLPGRIH